MTGNEFYELRVVIILPVEQGELEDRRRITNKNITDKQTIKNTYSFGICTNYEQKEIKMRNPNTRKLSYLQAY